MGDGRPNRSAADGCGELERELASTAASPPPTLRCDGDGLTPVRRAGLNPTPAPELRREEAGLEPRGGGVPAGPGEPREASEPSEDRLSCSVSVSLDRSCRS